MKRSPRSVASYSWPRSRGTSTRERQRRVVGIGHPLLGRERALELDPQVAVAAALGQAEVVRRILLLVHHRIIRHRRAQHVPAHAVAQQRVRILLDVEHGAAVVGPDEIRFDVDQGVGQQFAGHEVLEAHRPLPPADAVLGPGQHATVDRDLVVADLEIGLAGRHRVGIEQQLLGRLERALAARVDRELAAGLVARVVPVAVLALRHRAIVGLDAADDLAIDRVLQRPRVREHGIRVGVLGREVGQHLGVRAGVVAQPVVLVDAVAVGGGHGVGQLGRDGWDCGCRGSGPIGGDAGGRCPLRPLATVGIAGRDNEGDGRPDHCAQA